MYVARASSLPGDWEGCCEEERLESGCRLGGWGGRCRCEEELESCSQSLDGTTVCSTTTTSTRGRMKPLRRSLYDRGSRCEKKRLGA